jgi:hypothetical protein
VLSVSVWLGGLPICQFAFFTANSMKEFLYSAQWAGGWVCSISRISNATADLFSLCGLGFGMPFANTMLHTAILVWSNFKRHRKQLKLAEMYGLNLPYHGQWQFV